MVDAFEFAPHELVVLEHACRAADDAARIANELAAQSLTVTGSNGQPVANALLRELRETRAQVAKLLALLDLPGDDSAGQWDNLTASQRARKAASVRWARRGA
jgi:hypothetical protein